MSPVGRAAAVGAMVLGSASVAVWIAGSEPTTAVGSTSDGAALFRAKGCASCHTGPDSVAGFANFPKLDDAPAWAGDRRSGMSAAEYIAESIRAPGEFVSPAYAPSGGPATAMPVLTLTDAEVELLVDYLLGS